MCLVLLTGHTMYEPHRRLPISLSAGCDRLQREESKPPANVRLGFLRTDANASEGVALPRLPHNTYTQGGDGCHRYA